MPSNPPATDSNTAAAIAPSTISTVDQLSSSARTELRSISASLIDLRQKISSQYTDLRSHPYSLHSIFVHRGTSSFGHYWIYIYDFEREIWRKYNDSSVTEVQDTNEIFKDLERQQPGGASPPTSVYLVYVKEDERANLVGSVLRDPITPEDREQPIPEIREIEMTDTEPAGEPMSSSASSSTALRGGSGGGGGPQPAVEEQTSRFSFESDDFENTRADVVAESRAPSQMVSQSSGTAAWDDREAAAPAPPDFGKGSGGGGGGGGGGGDVGMKW